MNAVESNEKYPHVMSGPEHLELGLSLAAAARTVIEDYASYGARSTGLSSVVAEFADRAADADGTAGAANAVAALAQLAQVHVQAAKVLTLATLAATEGEGFGEDWAELLDPDGSKREAVKIERAHSAALMENDRRDMEARMAAMRESWAADDEKPVDYLPAVPEAGSYCGPDGLSWNPGPLVPAADPRGDVSDEQAEQAGRELADSLLGEDFDERDGAR